MIISAWGVIYLIVPFGLLINFSFGMLTLSKTGLRSSKPCQDPLLHLHTHFLRDAWHLNTTLTGCQVQRQPGGLLSREGGPTTHAPAHILPTQGGRWENGGDQTLNRAVALVNFSDYRAEHICSRFR
jgi:hypothetical protein